MLRLNQWVICVLLLLPVLANRLSADELSFQAADGVPGADGILRHHVTSKWQSGDTSLSVLLPENLKPGERLRVVYLLPVEAGDGARWGNALAEVQRLKLHERYRVMCVYPTFAQLPWFADHPSDSGIAQESYFVKGVVPFVDRTYPTPGTRDGRLLLGFSKSGWGAFTLLLRNGEVFEKAAAWDAPFLMERPGQYGSGPIFGTDEQFRKYCVTDLLKQHAGEFSTVPRMLHLGYGNFRDHHVGLERLLNELNVAHVYRHGPSRTHAWGSGWIPDAMQFLCE